MPELTLGQYLARARQVLGWSQNELARRSGVHRSYIADIEADRKSPTWGRLQALCRAMEIHTGELADIAPEVLTPARRA